MDRDLSERLTETVAQALAEQQPLTITGTGSKAFLLGSGTGTDSRLLSVSEHQGVIEYRPEELVLTARAGTRLKDLRHLLSQHDQMLPFEPPEFRGLGTLGGAVASGLSGPGRPWRGSLRDAVLGVRLINGDAQVLNFGGRVVKNVAGYDVSRLQAGAFGTLGVLLDISIRVIPAPAASQTRVLELPAVQALTKMRELSARALPLTGLCHDGHRLYARLEGAEAAVLAAAAEIGGELDPPGNFWARLNTLELEFFSQPGLLVRDTPPPATVPEQGWRGLIDWAGGRRWHFQQDAADLAASAVIFDHRYAAQVCQAPGGSRLLGEYQARLRSAFDPGQLFNLELSHADVAA